MLRAQLQKPHFLVLHQIRRYKKHGASPAFLVLTAVPLYADSRHPESSLRQRKQPWILQALRVQGAVLIFRGLHEQHPAVMVQRPIFLSVLTDRQMHTVCQSGIVQRRIDGFSGIIQYISHIFLLSFLISVNTVITIRFCIRRTPHLQAYRNTSSTALPSFTKAAN